MASCSGDLDGLHLCSSWDGASRLSSHRAARADLSVEDYGEVRLGADSIFFHSSGVWFVLFVPYNPASAIASRVAGVLMFNNERTRSISSSRSNRSSRLGTDYLGARPHD